VVAPPSTSSQHAPHVGRRHPAHGPAAIAPQCEQRALGGSSDDMSDGTDRAYGEQIPSGRFLNHSNLLRECLIIHI